MTLIVHITSPAQWLQARQNGEYCCASLLTDGFIHASKPEQAIAVANRFYSGQSDLVLLWINPARVRAEIRWETVLDHGTFPHIYGRLNLDAVVGVTPFVTNAQGVFEVLPPLP
ncbi:DUF952 domain-containing protein [Spirulina subsalsa]|uniref:DUF952 domain-containing protein n=1 Tax=Spirulina subsalsa TaxID=54311 RepID=UPI00030AE901|nr:DUF952 domain-containing protein [Spirulina subsalsa]